jgi:hypothetical protein
MARYSREQSKRSWRVRQTEAAEFLELVEGMGFQAAAEAMNITAGALELEIKRCQDKLLLPMPPQYGRRHIPRPA